MIKLQELLVPETHEINFGPSIDHSTVIFHSSLSSQLSSNDNQISQ